MDIYRSIQRQWMGLEGQHGKNPTYGDTELKKAGDIITLGTGSVEMGDGEHASAFNLPKFWDRL